MRRRHEVLTSLLLCSLIFSISPVLEANGGDNLNLTNKQISELRAAVADNDIAAIHMLGVLYITGQGVEKDMKRGTALIQRAADRGFANSQLLLAAAYNTGHGAYKKDIVKSLAWAMMAKSQGLARAEDYFQYVASESSPDQLRQAQELYKKLAAAE